MDQVILQAIKLTAKEVGALPKDYPVLRYNGFTKSIKVIPGGKMPGATQRWCDYYIFDTPPQSFYENLSKNTKGYPNKG